MVLKIKKVFILFFLSLFVFSLGFGKDNGPDKIVNGGVVVGFRSTEIRIPVKFLPSNLNIYAPDSCILILKSGPSMAVDSVTKKSYYYYLVNKKINRINGSLDSQLGVQELIDSFNEMGQFKEVYLFYYDEQKKVNKYIIVNHLAKKLKEVKLIATGERVVETLLYSQQGVLFSRTLNRLDTGKTNAVFTNFKEKIGQSLYFATGKLKANIKYKNGLITDTLTMFDKDGGIIRQYIYENDKIVKTLREPLKSQSQITGNHKKAVLIGIDNYTEPKDLAVLKTNKNYFDLPDLAGAANDAKLLKQVLVSNQGFKEGNVKLIIDRAQTTKESILNYFNQFTAQLLPADVVFLHFSAMSHVLKDGEDLFIVTSDYYKSKNDSVNTYWITKNEINKVFNDIKRKIGSKGQLIVSYDACGLAADKPEKKKAAEDLKLRGEVGNLLMSSSKFANVPFMVLSGTTGNELAFETGGDDGKSYGLYSYSLATALNLPYSLTDDDLMTEVKFNMLKKNSNQTPNYYSNFPQYLFEQNQSSTTEQGVTLAEIKPKGNAHIISVGISQYPKTGKLSFLNCVADATSYDQYFTDQYKSLTETGSVSSYLLTDSLATKKNILDAINKTMTSKPEDYFVFNFSGYTVPLKDSLGKQLTYFIPYGLKTLTDTAEIKKNGISLIQLKELLQMIPANNQLFITEAGSTTNFQKEFIKNLIESSPTLAALSNKNRVFVVPKGVGMDNMVCNNRDIQHGPLNYYITNLTSDLNIYGLFETDLYVNALKYAIGKAEADCDYIRSGYFDVFFERNFINDLQYFMPEQAMQMRGAKVRNQTKDKLSKDNSKRYALVIGTNNYKANVQWGNLNNPAPDARAIADELENNYDYKVMRLIDKPLDSIYNKVLELSKLLKESDQLVIFVAGHGDFDDNLLDDGLIVTNDSKTSKDDPFRNSYIQYSKLSRMINKLPPNQILLLMDVCFGGTFDERVARNVARSGETMYDDMNAAAYIDGKLGKKTRIYITSGGKKEVPDGYAGKHSPFAQRLIMALQGRGGANSMLTAKNLYQFVEKLPSGPLLGSFGDDEPGSEFLLIPNIPQAKSVITVAKN